MVDEKRIEQKISRTAEFTCLIRASSFCEKTVQYKSFDYVALKMLPTFFIPVLRFSVLRNIFKNRFFPPGMYEYVIARTKFIDSVFENAIVDGFDQILIFGAGFDSRGIRFGKASNNAKIFELDAPVTQEAKINQLKKRGVEINPNIIFISIDFNRESIENKLIESGFCKNKKSLFILEGLTMYLDTGAIDNTFEVIDRFAGDGSEVVFDYVYSSVLREENLYYGESEVYKGVKKENEPWCFGIEKGELRSFLKDKNLELIEILTSKDLEQEFFKNDDGIIVGKVNGTHCISHARKEP